MNPVISIIIPVWNQAEKIGDCLESLLQQSFTDWELIVVNDGSTDDIANVIERFQFRFPSGRFHFFSKENEGSNPTRNYGAERAQGSFLLFSDADITFKPEALATMFKTLAENPDKSFAYCSFRYGSKLFRLFPYDEERLRRMPYIHSTSLIRREHFPGFDNSIRRLQDWDLWLTMLREGHTGIWIDSVLFDVKTGGHISSWLPKAAYKIFPFCRR